MLLYFLKIEKIISTFCTFLKNHKIFENSVKKNLKLSKKSKKLLNFLIFSTNRTKKYF